MQGGPPIYESREKEQEIEEKQNLARQNIAKAYAEELEKIVESAPTDSKSLIADAICYALESFVYGYSPAQSRIEKFLSEYKSERVNKQNLYDIKDKIWQEQFKK